MPRYFFHVYDGYSARGNEAPSFPICTRPEPKPSA